MRMKQKFSRSIDIKLWVFQVQQMLLISSPLRRLNLNEHNSPIGTQKEHVDILLVLGIKKLRQKKEIKKKEIGRVITHNWGGGVEKGKWSSRARSSTSKWKPQACGKDITDLLI